MEGVWGGSSDWFSSWNQAWRLQGKTSSFQDSRGKLMAKQGGREGSTDFVAVVGWILPFARAWRSGQEEFYLSTGSKP